MVSAAGYNFRGLVIPERMGERLDAWVQHHQLPGDFLQAVLRNDLREAVGRADAVNLHALPAYIGYLYNEAPSPCWGSPEKVAEWAARAKATGSAA